MTHLEKFRKYVNSKLEMDDDDLFDWYKLTFKRDLSKDYTKFIKLNIKDKLSFVESFDGDRLFYLLLSILDERNIINKPKINRRIIEKYIHIIHLINKRAYYIRNL